jgi:hypothetical protein
VTADIGSKTFTPRVNARAASSVRARSRTVLIGQRRFGESVAEPNFLLDALIEAAGLSHAGLASRINAAEGKLSLRYDHASVARWIRDGAVPRHPVPNMICEILSARLGRSLALADIGMEGKVVGTSGLTLRRVVEQAKALWRADDRARTAAQARTLVTGADAVLPLFEWENPPLDIDVSRHNGQLIGQSDVAQVLAARAHYEQMYRRVGGVPVRPRLVNQLAVQITPMLDGRYDDATGRLLFRAVGGLVALAGICAYDAERQTQALAQRYFFHALRMAKASGDKAFGGYVVALLTNQAIHLGDFRLAIQYAETALRAGQGFLSPALRTDLHAMQAKSYARIGDRASCHDQMRLAEVAAAQVIVENEPPETGYVQPENTKIKHAEALMRLGDTSAAKSYAREAVNSKALFSTRARVYGMATLSMTLAARAEVEEGVAHAELALHEAAGMESWRIRERLAAMVSALAPYRDTHAAQDLMCRADSALSLPL